MHIQPVTYSSPGSFPRVNDKDCENRAVVLRWAKVSQSHSFVWSVYGAVPFYILSNAFFCPSLHGYQHTGPCSRNGRNNDVLATLYCISISFLRTHSTKCGASLAFWNVSVTWSTQFNHFERLFPSIYNYSLPEILVTNGVKQWIFNPSSCKSYCFNLPRFISTPGSTAHSLRSFRSICNFLCIFICTFSTYHTLAGEESNIRVNVPPNNIYLQLKL
jgi:hypothetical protein